MGCCVNTARTTTRKAEHSKNPAASERAAVKVGIGTNAKYTCRQLKEVRAPIPA
jgi:hypothetical protein